jgi:hypothetical protein
LSGILWMFFISILLFWLSVIVPLLAGVVGGKKAGGVGKGLIAVFLLGIVLACALFGIASTLTGIPVIGYVAAMGGLTLALLGIGPLLIEARSSVLRWLSLFGFLRGGEELFPQFEILNIEYR